MGFRGIPRGFRLLVILACALALVLVISFVLEWLPTGWPNGSTVSSLTLRLFDPESISNLDVIRIRKESGLIELHREDGSWWVISGAARFPALESRIGRLIELLTASRRMNPVSRSASAWPDLGLDAQTAWKIELGERSADPDLPTSRTGTALSRALYLGFTDSTGERLFVRREGEEQSWITDSALMSALGRDERSWYDLEPISAKAASRLDTIIIRLFGSEDSATTLQKLSGYEPSWRWEFLDAVSGQSDVSGTPGSSAAGPQHATEQDEGEASRIARQIVALHAQDLAATSQQASASEEWRVQIQLFSDDGSVLRLLVGHPDPRGLTPLQVMDRPWIYLIRDSDLDFIRAVLGRR